MLTYPKARAELTVRKRNASLNFFSTRLSNGLSEG